MDTPEEDKELKALLAEADVPKSIPTEPNVNESNSVQHIQIKNDPTTSETKNITQEDEAQKVFKQFLQVSNTILQNYNADREQIEKTIQYLDTMTQLGPKSGRVYVEMLVAALRTKAETNTNAVKLLDAMAKLLSAGKGTQLFIQQNQSSAPADLIKLLETPEYPDEKPRV